MAAHVRTFNDWALGTPRQAAPDHGKSSWNTYPGAPRHRAAPPELAARMAAAEPAIDEASPELRAILEPMLKLAEVTPRWHEPRRFRIKRMPLDTHPAHARASWVIKDSTRPPWLASVAEHTLAIAQVAAQLIAEASDRTSDALWVEA